MKAKLHRNIWRSLLIFWVACFGQISWAQMNVAKDTRFVLGDLPYGMGTEVSPQKRRAGSAPLGGFIWDEVRWDDLGMISALLKPG